MCVCVTRFKRQIYIHGRFLFYNELEGIKYQKRSQPSFCFLRPKHETMLKYEDVLRATLASAMADVNDVD